MKKETFREWMSDGTDEYIITNPYRLQTYDTVEDNITEAEIKFYQSAFLDEYKRIINKESDLSSMNRKYILELFDNPEKSKVSILKKLQ